MKHNKFTELVKEKFDNNDHCSGLSLFWQRVTDELKAEKLMQDKQILKTANLLTWCLPM